jgi:hypothetical protein
VIHCPSILLVMGPLPQWLNFLVMAVVVLVVAVGSLIWLTMFRKKRRRKRRHRSQEKRQLNPTLAETGGLPPAREEKPTDGPIPPP